MVPVVFVHGIRLSSAAWTDQIEHVESAASIDLPGHGRRRGERFTLSLAVQAVVDAIDERALVVGHSLGGYVAIAAAARHPERVAGLIANGSGTTFAPAGRVFREWVAIPAIDRDLWQQLLAEAVEFAREQLAG